MYPERSARRFTFNNNDVSIDSKEKMKRSPKLLPRMSAPGEISTKLIEDFNESVENDDSDNSKEIYTPELSQNILHQQSIMEEKAVSRSPLKKQQSEQLRHSD